MDVKSIEYRDLRRRQKFIMWAMVVIGIMTLFSYSSLEFTPAIWTTIFLEVIIVSGTCYLYFQKKLVNFFTYWTIGGIASVNACLVYVLPDVSNIYVSWLVMLVGAFYLKRKTFLLGFSFGLICIMYSLWMQPEVMDISSAAQSTSIDQLNTYINYLTYYVLASIFIYALVQIGSNLIKDLLDTHKQTTALTNLMSDKDAHLMAGVESISESVNNINELSNEFQTSFTNMNASFHEIGKTLEFQAHTLTNINEAMVEDSQFIETIQARTQELHAGTGDVRDTSIKGEQFANQFLDTFQSFLQKFQISIQTLHGFQSSLKKLVESSHEISEIASTTNILSINAGIEAARAGSAGKGFSVIAEEVRTLSNRTKSLAEHIRVGSDQIKNSSESVGTSFSEMVLEAQNNLTLVTQCAEFFQVICAQVEELYYSASAVSSDINSIKNNNDTVCGHMEDFMATLQQNSAALEQLIGMSDSLGEQNKATAIQITDTNVALAQLTMGTK
ncbi:Methyl-accepting chemotaxis protein 2 [compost metagenome]